MNNVTHRMSRSLVDGVIEQRGFASIVFSIAIGLILSISHPFPADNAILRFISTERHATFSLFAWTYTLFLFTTPFLMLSTVYVHAYKPASGAAAGKLPPYPEPRRRDDLFVVLGETHRQMEPTPAE